MNRLSLLLQECSTVDEYLIRVEFYENELTNTSQFIGIDVSFVIHKGDGSASIYNQKAYSTGDVGLDNYSLHGLSVLDV